MHNILDDLLEYINVGQIISHPQRTFVGEILDKVILDLRKKIHSKQIKVNVKVNGTIALTDPQRLREVFFNLIDNAIKFSDNNSEIEIGSEKKGEELTLYIKDRGIGINKEYHHRIFDMFERLSVESEGTGIGLSICKRIVEIQGGKIWVDSDGLGKGSTFYFTIPKTV